MKSLREAGHRVVLVDPIPGFPAANPEGRFWYPYQCHTLSTILEPGSCGQVRDKTEVKAELAPFAQMLKQVSAETGAEVLSLESELCADRKCATNTGNFWDYMDGQHISVEKSKALGAGWFTVG